MVDKLEVHLILKPERAEPNSFESLVMRSPEARSAAINQVACKCGAHLGDTLPHGPGRASFTAFKSNLVRLFSARPLRRKETWTEVYLTEPVSDIEARGRGNLFGSFARGIHSRPRTLAPTHMLAESSSSSGQEPMSQKNAGEHGGGGNVCRPSVARAIADYDPGDLENQGYLGLRLDDHVTVLYVGSDIIGDDNWSYGQSGVGERRGWFPLSRQLKKRGGLDDRARSITYRSSLKCSAGASRSRSTTSSSAYRRPHSLC